MELDMSDPATKKAPFWRNASVLRILFQVLFLVGAAMLAGFLYANMMRGLKGLGLTVDFDFLGLEAGFGISEGIAYDPSDTYSRAFWVGALNTIKVSILGVLLATLLGLIFGVAALSGNWLVRKIALIYVECFRNIPLLLQILFWYSAVLLQLPPVRQSVSVGQSLFINQRGVYLSWPQATPGFRDWVIYLAAGIAAAVVLYLARRKRLNQSGRPGSPFKWAAPVFAAVAVLGWFLASQKPLVLDTPVLQRFNFTGGAHLSPEFTALLISLSVYTGAFISEVVRGGIQSVKSGQKEAAEALGLKGFQVLKLVVLPQALRIIVPPLSNQYLNLAKNSSLAIAIGFPDLFNIGNTMMNQTGQSIPVFAMIMASYLIMSLTASVFLNLYNRRLKIVER